jgi:DNA repair protein RadC
MKRISMNDMPDKHRIKDLAEADRPREKLMEKGEEALTNAELLAILIGSGTPKKSAVELMREVLEVCDNRLSLLGRMTIAELMRYNGIGEAKAIAIKAAAELGRRRSMETIDDLPKFADSQSIYDYMAPLMRDLPYEEAWALLLNNNLRLIRRVRMSSGGLTETLVDVRRLMKEVLQADATCFVLLHNHPSGSLRPSRDDNSLTERVKNAATVLNIRMIDHIIVTDGGYYSYMDEGKL